MAIRHLKKIFYDFFSLVAEDVLSYRYPQEVSIVPRLNNFANTGTRRQKSVLPLIFSMGVPKTTH